MTAPDPGWPNPLRFLVPFGLGTRRQARGRPLVWIHRSLWMAFTYAILMIGVVVAILAPDLEHDSGLAVPAAVVVGAYGLASAVFGPRIGQALDCTSDASLLGTYRTRFFLRIAVAEAAALLGFVGFLLGGEWWLYPLGAVFTLAGFARVAPTAGHLAAVDQELLAQGCGRSFSDLMLRGPEE